MSGPEHQTSHDQIAVVESPPRRSTMYCGFGATNKIRDSHLDRLAIVYIRQSSPQQVLENRESRERQYALGEFAQRLGWPKERVMIIDDDQGQSGTTAEDRAGFQRLMTEVTLNHVGIVLGLELSRLSRSNRDWHQLIDVCGVFGTLLCDEDAAYDPLDSNDRLLLGMKGAMSEFELVTLRNRLLRGSRNKAERGELFLSVPIGYLKLPSGEVIQEPDEQAREMVQLVFDKFQELGSAYAVYRYLVTQDMRLGFRCQRGSKRGELEWRNPLPNRILSILRHPIYTGAYSYGIHRNGKRNSVTGQLTSGAWFVPPNEMEVLLHDRLPAYIRWDQYLSNQERLTQNRSRHDARGVPRQGHALLAGLMVCGKCGLRMTTKYHSDKQPSYECDQYWRQPMEETCGRTSAQPVDSLVVQQVLLALQPASLELSLHTTEQIEKERKRLHAQWRQKLDRSQYEIQRAERQYQAVEPENRLVAKTLETRWEQSLNDHRQLEEDDHRFLAKLPEALSAADRDRILELSDNLIELWQSPGTSHTDRKQIIRCLVDHVIVTPNKRSEQVDVTIVWQGEYRSQHEVRRPVGCYEQLQDFETLTNRIRQLHDQGLHVPQIATTLNREGFVPPRRRGQYTVGTLAPLMKKLGLVGELFRDEMLQANEWWIPDLAKQLEVIPQKLHYWAKRGWLHSRRTLSGKHWIVWADSDEIQRFSQLKNQKNSWVAARNPDLVIPKPRPNR